jgi:hypothetical protein
MFGMEAFHRNFKGKCSSVFADVMSVWNGGTHRSIPQERIGFFRKTQEIKHPVWALVSRKPEATRARQRSISSVSIQLNGDKRTRRIRGKKKEIAWRTRALSQTSPTSVCLLLFFKRKKCLLASARPATTPNLFLAIPRCYP